MSRLSFFSPLGLAMATAKQTARTARTRVLEHINKMKKKDKESALWNHAVEHHNKEMPEISVEITGSYLKRPLQRQLMEAVRIDQTPADIRLNSKNEWHLPFSLGLSLERGATNF